MKAAVIGAYSTGKTSLVGALAAHLAGHGVTVALVADAARDCPLPLNQHQTFDASAWIIGEQIRRESEAHAAGRQLVLADRTPIDAISHVIATPAIADQAQAQSLILLAQAWSTTYDLLLRTTVDVTRPIIADGLREPDRGYQLELDDTITRALSLTGANAVRLPFDEPERWSAALVEIERILKPTR